MTSKKPARAVSWNLGLSGVSTNTNIINQLKALQSVLQSIRIGICKSDIIPAFINNINAMSDDGMQPQSVTDTVIKSMLNINNVLTMLPSELKTPLLKSMKNLITSIANASVKNKLVDFGTYKQNLINILQTLCPESVNLQPSKLIKLKELFDENPYYSIPTSPPIPPSRSPDRR